MQNFIVVDYGDSPGCDSERRYRPLAVYHLAAEHEGLLRDLLELGLAFESALHVKRNEAVKQDRDVRRSKMAPMGLRVLVEETGRSWIEPFGIRLSKFSPVRRLREQVTREQQRMWSRSRFRVPSSSRAQRPVLSCRLASRAETWQGLGEAGEQGCCGVHVPLPAVVIREGGAPLQK